MYTDTIKSGPTWTLVSGLAVKWLSAIIRKALAWSIREGETESGKLVDRLSPDAEIASWRRGMLSLMRLRSVLMSVTRWRIATWLVWRGANDAILWPSKMISFWSDAVSVNADSRALFPCPDLSSIKFIAGVMTYNMLAGKVRYCPEDLAYLDFTVEVILKSF